MKFDDLALSADTANIQAGGQSIFQDIADATTAGVAGAVVSGLGSIYNTGVQLSNKVFDTDLQQLDTKDVLTSVNDDWGKYYDEHKGAIDTVGFLGASFIPGSLAVKGLNLARAGEGLGAFRSALGYTTRQQAVYLRQGLNSIASGGADAFTLLNQNKLASMAFGAADQVLQTAVFETAAAVSMQASPVLAGEDWKDVAWDITKTSLAGGILGGGIEALWTNKIFRDAGKLVSSTARKYDTIDALEKMGLSFGDEAFSIMDSVMALPKEVFEADKKLDFSYILNGKTVSHPLETAGLYDKKLQGTFNKGLELMQGKLANVVVGDTSVGTPVGQMLINLVREGKKLGKDDFEIRNEVGNYLFNLRTITGIGAEDTTKLGTKELVYLRPGQTLKTLEKDSGTYPFAPGRTTVSDKGFMVIGDPATAKSGFLGVGDVPLRLDDAYAAGYDVLFRPGTTKIHVNPNSKIFKELAPGEDATLTRVLNVRTRQVSDSFAPTIADLATGTKKLVVNDNGVAAGNQVFKFGTESFDKTTDSVEASARNLWATTVKDLRDTTIDSNDFALLDRLREKPDLGDFTTKIRFQDGSVRSLDDIANLGDTVLAEKVTAAKEMLSHGASDLDARAAAVALNVEPSWIESAVATHFDVNKLRQPDAFRDLGSYSQRDNLVLKYNKPPIADPKESEFVTGLEAYHYRRSEAIRRGQEAATSVLGQYASRFLDTMPGTAKFDETGVGATGFGASNANYNDAGRVWAQDTGRATHQTKQDFRNEALDPLLAPLQAVVRNGNKELGAVLNKIRLSDFSVALSDDGRLVDLAGLKKYNEILRRVQSGRASAEDLQSVQFKLNVPLQDDTYQFLQEYQRGHQKWLDRQTQLAAAQGKTLDWDPMALYAPPVNTKRVPFFAFVRAQDGRVFSGSDVAMVTAKTSDDLATLTARIQADHPDLQVIFKKDTADFHKAQGDYDFASGLNSPQIDPLLRKAGKLGDFLPVLEPQAVAEEFVKFIGQREDNLVRNAVQVMHGQTFQELRYLSSENTKIAQSKFQFLGGNAAVKISDPFGDYARTALDISKRAEFTLWHEANEFVDALGTRAYSAIERSYLGAKDGKQDWVEAERVLNKFGIGGVFKDQQGYLLAQSGADRSIVKTAVAKGNMLLANIALRLDWANSLVNVISTPILLGTEVSAIRSSLKSDPELLMRFNSSMQQALPDGQSAVPSTVRLLYNAVKNYWGADRIALINRYKDDVGSIRDHASLFHDMIDDLALAPKIGPKAWSDKVSAWTEKGAQLTGNNAAEQFTRFVSSDVMRQITQPVVDAGKMDIKEQNAFINIFTNRVQGNYVSSQRPIMFQGTLGAAIGLFQTYQFNMFQQLFRHIENRDWRTLAVAGGLQSSIFGLNGLPFFDAINTHLLGNASINEGHRDIYSGLVANTNPALADWALYGTASAFPAFSDKAPSLYTRGDLNPRSITIVPTSLADLPVVEASTRVVKATLGVAQQVANGGDLSLAMLNGLEHNGISRPLAGLAQVLQGESTTSKGALISANSDLLSIASLSRLLGAKPIDESVALNHKYRMAAYQAADQERLEALGTVVKEKIRHGGLAPEDIQEFQGRYAAAGGRVPQYSSALQRWFKTANQSDLNILMQAHNTARGQRMFEVMGGDPLPDYLNQAPRQQQVQEQ